MGINNQGVVHAEISIIPIGTRDYSIQRDEKTIPTSMSKEIAVAFDAIRKIKGIKPTLNPMGTQIESTNIQNVLKAIEVAHKAIKDKGIKRIITTVRIDERLDKVQTLEDKVKSVKEKLPNQ